MQTNGVNNDAFFTPFVSFDSYGVKKGTYLHQILNSANTHRNTIHVTQADRRHLAPRRLNPCGRLRQPMGRRASDFEGSEYQRVTREPRAEPPKNYGVGAVAF